LEGNEKLLLLQEAKGTTVSDMRVEEEEEEEKGSSNVVAVVVVTIADAIAIDISLPRSSVNGKGTGSQTLLERLCCG
jgi:hypothetical protein